MKDILGQNFGRYHVTEKLGEGGMATVYKAYDTRLERDVAVKVIRKDAFSNEVIDRILKRFEREAKAMAKLNHPNIVPIIDFGEFENNPFLVMPYLPGGTLKQIKTPLYWLDAVRLLEPVARALAYAHEKGILHRDVKPANILITEKNEPVLTDFGIAKLLETEEGQTLTGTGVGVGTPEYMAPEQGLGKEVDSRADIYSLGIVLYELVTGNKPYLADTPMAVVLKQVTDPLPNPRQYAPDLPDAVANLLYKALAKEPSNRYLNMQEFALALKKLESIQPEDKKVKEVDQIVLRKKTADLTTRATLDDLRTNLQPSLSSSLPDKPILKLTKHPSKSKQRSRHLSREIIGILVGGSAIIVILTGILSGWFNPKTTPFLFPAPTFTQTITPSPTITLAPTSTPTSIPFFVISNTSDSVGDRLSFKYSDGGGMIASVSENGVVSTWGWNGTLYEKSSWNATVNGNKYRDQFNSVALYTTEDSMGEYIDYLAAGSYFGHISIYSIDEELHIFYEENLHDDMHYVTDVAFSPEGYLINASDSGFIRIWDANDDFKLIDKIKISNDYIDLSKDGRYLVVAAYSGTVSTIDMTTRDIICSNKLSDAYFTDIAISENGLYTAAITHGGEFFVVNTMDCEEKFHASTTNDSNESYISFFKDNYVITSGDYLVAWELKENEIIKRAEFTGVDKVAVSPNYLTSKFNMVGDMSGKLVTFNIYP